MLKVYSHRFHRSTQMGSFRGCTCLRSALPLARARSAPTKQEVHQQSRLVRLQSKIGSFRGCTCLKCTNKAKGALTKQNRCSPTDFTDRHRCLGFEGLPQNPRNSQMRGCLQGICENLCNLWEFLFNSQLRIKVRSCRNVRTAVLLSVWRGRCSPSPALP